MREILFVAGEASGDLHAAGVARELVARGAPYRLVGVGGDAMQAAGVELIAHVGHDRRDGLRRAAQAPAEVPRAAAAPHRANSIGQRRARRADRLRGVQHARGGGAAAAGVPVLYYITPQVWASRARRLERLAQTMTKAAVILPVRGAAAAQAWHRRDVRRASAARPPGQRSPIAREARRRLGFGAEDRVLALFPGSRRQEIERHLDAFVATARELQRRIPGLEVVVGLAPNITIDPARCPFDDGAIGVVHAAARGRRRAVQERHDDARGGGRRVPARRGVPRRALDYAVGKWLVKIPHIGLVNIVAGQAVAPEFIQDALQPVAVADTLEPLLNLDERRARAMVGGARRGARVARRAGRRGARRARWREDARRSGTRHGADARRGATHRMVRSRGRVARAPARVHVARSSHARRRRAPLRADEAADHVHPLARPAASVAVSPSRRAASRC